MAHRSCSWWSLGGLAMLGSLLFLQNGFAQQAMDDATREKVMEVQEKAMDGDFETATKMMDELLEEDPANSRLVMMATQLYFRKGFASFEEDRKLANPPFMRAAELMRGLHKAKGGDLTAMEMQLYINAIYNEACCYAIDEETDKALDTLQEVIDLGYNDVDHMEDDEDLDSLRDLPRFQKMMAELEGEDGDDDDDDDDHDDDDDDDDHDDGDDG